MCNSPTDPLLRTPTTSARDKTVLIIDDDPIITQTIRHLLKHMNVGSASASQWAEAIDALEHASPDLVLLDIRMPNVDGPTLLEFVRESGSDVPVVVVSALLNEVDLDRLRELGVVHFVPKPFSAEQLRGIIEDQLQLSRPGAGNADEGARKSRGEDEPTKTVAVSSTRSILGGRWKPKAGPRRHKKKQFWTIAIICVGLWIAVLGAKLILAETDFLSAIEQSLRSQSEMSH